MILMKTIFLTGSSGFIGQVAVRTILQSMSLDDRLYLLVRRPVQNFDHRVVPVQGDLRNLELISNSIQRADYVIHVAAEARLLGRHDYFGINADPVRNMIKILQPSNRLERFIFISSIAAMDRSPSDKCKEPITIESPCCPRSEYGRSKLLAEKIIVQSGLPYTIFRPGFVYGPGMRDDSHLRKLAHCINHGVPLNRIGFPGRISLIHVGDLAAAMLKCITGDSGRNCIYLAGTEVMPLGEALAILGKLLLGRKLAQIPFPGMKYLVQRFHSRLPITATGMLIDYLWMDDPDFRGLFADNYLCRSFREAAMDIVVDLHKGRW